MANQADKVIILMAVYNGAAYLRSQLDSILAQDHQNWELLVRDDGSSDSSISVIIDYQRRDDRIRLIDQPAAKHGACANFGALYKWARINREAAYLMFSDQDDIWKPAKISQTLQLVKAEEAKAGGGIMAYGSLELIDEQNNRLQGTIRLKQVLSFPATLAQNYAFGCTMMLNPELVALIPEIPDWAENHDYWVCLVACGLGKTVFQEQAMILYRQHMANVTSQGNSFSKRWKRFAVDFESQLDTLRNRIAMFRGFHTRYNSRLSPADQETLERYLESFSSSKPVKRIQTALRYKILKQGLLQNAGFFYTLLRSGRIKEGSK